MRRNKVAAQRKAAKKHSVAERKEMRSVKRKSGPSALRRRKRREELQTKSGSQPD